MSKQTTTTVLVIPQTLAEVENLVTKNLLWRLGAVGKQHCRDIVSDAIEALTVKYSHPSQLRAYQLEKGRLTHLLNKI